MKATLYMTETFKRHGDHIVNRWYRAFIDTRKKLPFIKVSYVEERITKKFGVSWKLGQINTVDIRRKKKISKSVYTKIRKQALRHV